jgi:hypothetical protein
MKKLLILSFISAAILLLSCEGNFRKHNQKTNSMSSISQETIDKAIKSLTEKFKDSDKLRIEKGVKQIAALWQEKDGKKEDFEKFCLENFAPSDKEVEELFLKLSENFEIIFGNFNKIGLELKQTLHLDKGEVKKIDEIFGSYEPMSHFNDDFFTNKLAFTTALNFPFYSLKEKTELGPKWDRKKWAYVRLGDMFTSRIPADLLQKTADAATASDTYISEYNIFMGNLKDNSGKSLFAKDLKLISHWGLRDELKSHYGNAEGLDKQMMIYEVMKRIITQEIPDSVINNPNFEWNPYTNKLFKKGKEVNVTPEPDKRYEFLLGNFNALKAIDKYSPNYPTYIERKFDQEMEIPQADVEKLFTDLLSSPQVKQVAQLISKRLNRKLQPFDIWYDGFKARSSVKQEDLDAKVKAKYPTKDAFEKDLPNILVKLGFKAEMAQSITSKISVEASRGPGHALGALMKSDKSHLRTRIGKDGMNYKGYNIAIHEFGHNVEQTISLQDVDYYMLAGVPSTAFTEALAFIFQKRDLELLGIKDANPDKEFLLTLDNFWACYEIMGVSIVDMHVWQWLYEHPNATPKELKESVIRISKEVWNKYYADVFGIKDQPILAIYSHMIDAPLYLSAYPVGHLIDFQIEEQFKGKNFADETLRMFKYGRIIPQLWMKHAVGSEISIKPMLKATDEALKKIK